MKNKINALILFLCCSAANANDSAFNKARDSLFWPYLYSGQYYTLYCGAEKRNRKGIDVEHVYATHWIAEHLGCKNRRTCNNEIYLQASSDMHNLWPALQRYNRSRGKQAFGEIRGDEPNFAGDRCDFERTKGKGAIVEPRDIVKGNIARSIMYMIHRYDLPDHGMLPMLVRWHISDPVSPEETRRNNLIKKLQGRSNPFISVKN